MTSAPRRRAPRRRTARVWGGDDAMCRTNVRPLYHIRRGIDGEDACVVLEGVRADVLGVDHQAAGVRSVGGNERVHEHGGRPAGAHTQCQAEKHGAHHLE